MDNKRFRLANRMSNAHLVSRLSERNRKTIHTLLVDFTLHYNNIIKNIYPFFAPLGYICMYGCGCIPEEEKNSMTPPFTQEPEFTEYPTGPPPPSFTTPMTVELITTIPYLTTYPTQPSNPTCPTTGTIAISLCVGVSACPAGYFCIYGACCPFVVNRTCSDGSQPAVSCMNTTECSDGSTFNSFSVHLVFIF